jgi:hypothetical protein
MQARLPAEGRLQASAVLAMPVGLILTAMSKPSDLSMPPDQQPIQRVVGERVRPPPGTMPSAIARAAMTANAHYRTRAPKGIFFYESHAEMARDRERWTVDAIVAKQRERAPDERA